MAILYKMYICGYLKFITVEMELLNVGNPSNEIPILVKYWV